MKGLAQIQAENKEAAERVKKEGIVPLEMTESIIKNLKLGMIHELEEIPFIGEASFDNYLEMATYFVDSSGFGKRGEPALTIKEFINKLKVGYSYGISSIGQFQIYIQEYFSKEKEI